MTGSTTEKPSPDRGVRALSIQRKVVIGFAASALLVVLLTATSAVALKMALATDREAIRQAERLVGVALLRAALEQRVASFRGYLLTGEAAFLERLGRVRAEVVAHVRRLRQGSRGADADLLDAVERADRGYEEAAAGGLSLLRGGASPQELGRYIEMVTSQRRDALDGALGAFLSHKRRDLREAEIRAARENLWASGLILASGLGALLLLLALAVPVSRRLANVYEIQQRERERAEEAEAEQRKALAVAEAAVAARDDFLSIASHELKTPVATLQLLVQNLLRRFRADPSSVSPAAASERLEAVDKQVLRLTKLINDLLDLSRITDGRMELDLKPTDLASIVRDVVARHEEDARRAHCTVAVEVDSPARGVWDPMRLDQVVENLLSNAIKYGAGGRIEVRVDGDESVARLTVRDEGIGISADAQARIFQRFERAVSTNDYSGFGLGLWIVHQIVSAHAGDLSVESQPGRGSAFHVGLPRTPRAPQAAAVAEAPGYTDRRDT